MPDDSWERVEEIFLAAADTPLPQRDAFLERACSGDADLRREVESLLEADTEGVTALEQAFQNEAGAILDDELSLIGRRLGPYRILREIGHGGMGSVFLAERDDDQFHKTVALKVVKRGMDTRELLERFRHERQILAGLEHPYIARLLDGGATPDGRPFFVMERVEGQPIDIYCRDHARDVESILRLVLRVCEAVSHAHAALIVHRDLKPGNILVNRDGVPKLLDFGVAKLLRPDASSRSTLTSSGVGPLTPEYASPEQVRGLPVTTATDVYALGAILFELLTGTRAQKIPTLTPREIDRVVCETEPPRPSSVVRSSGKPLRLNSDLDTIVAVAMRKEPERRYASVEQLAGDITRYLDGRPLVARQDSFGYRTRKFVRRNRWALGAAAMLFATLLAGITVSMQQARRAETARKIADAQRHAADTQRRAADAQRRAAERERSRAEAEAEIAKTEQDRSDRRLAEMVELANRSLYDVHSAIEKLPGSLEARRQIVATTLQFLENLSKDSGQDDRLRLVLAAAYVKVADLQGYPLRPNLGDSRGALSSYDRAIALLAPLLAREPGNREFVVQSLHAEDNRGTTLAYIGKRTDTLARLRGLLPGAQRLVRLNPADSRCVLAEAALYSALYDTASQIDPLAATEYAHRQVESLEKGVRAVPGNDEILKELGTAYSEEAGGSSRLGRIRPALELFRKAIAIRERLLEHVPSDVLLRRSLMISYANLGGTLGSPLYANLGDTAGARASYGKALAIARELASADSNDRLAQNDLANALLHYALLDLPREEYPASLAMLREAESILQKLIAADPQSVSRYLTLATVEEYEGRRLQALGETGPALAQYRQSLASAERVLVGAASNLPAVAQALAAGKAAAELLNAQGDSTAALEMARQAVSRAEHFSAAATDRNRAALYLAGTYRVLASVQAAMGNWSDSRSSAERSIREWQHLRDAGSGFLNKAEAQKAEALLRESEAHSR